MNRDDQDRIDALRAAGAAGQAAGRDDGLPADDPGAAATGAGEDSRYLADVRRWASMLDADNYAARPENGNIVWEWQPPADIEAAMAASRSDLERRSQAHRLINTYSLRAVPPYLAAPPPLSPA